MSYEPGVQLKIQKRQQQGRGSSGKRYTKCPNCGEYYVRSMYIPVRNGPMKWIKIGVYCEGCGIAWTYRRKEHESKVGLSVDDYPL